MFKPNVVTNGLLMTGNKIKVVKKKKNSKVTSAKTADNTMFAAPEELSYNDPVAVQRRAEERSSQRLQDQSAANTRKLSPPPSKSDNRKKIRDAKKFHKKVGKNQAKSTEQSFNRQNLATGGVRGMVKEAGDTSQRDGGICGQTSTCARKVYDKFKKGQGGKVGKAHEKLMKNK